MQTRQGQATGIQFIDSLPIRVCHNRRIRSHKGFAGLAQRGKGSMGWFYGFKLHLVIDEQGELLGLTLTPGQVDDRRPVRKMVRQLWGKLFDDRGYNGIVKMLAAVVAYTFQPKKPALDLFTKHGKQDQQLLLAAMTA